jgi:fluoroquinolone transport system permease protein
VAKVYGVLPVSKSWFAVFRLLPPFFLAALATFALLLAEPFYGLPLLSNIVYSTLAGLVAPLMILSIAVTAKNKIEAMTWQKLFNIPLFLPVLAFFVPASFSVLFAVFPTYWAYRGFDLLIRGEDFLFYFLIGFGHSILLLVLLIKKFSKNHFA